MLIGECALCEKDRKLCESHIVSKFVFDWLKDTAPTNYLRQPQTPNLRKQDGLKIPLLCTECEGKFQKLETLFANNIFHPLIEDYHLEVEYGDWFYKFCVSISWRVAIYSRKQNAIGGEWDSGIERWRQILTGKTDAQTSCQFFWPLPPTESLDGLPDDFPVYWNRFVSRAIAFSAASIPAEHPTIRARLRRVWDRVIMRPLGFNTPPDPLKYLVSITKIGRFVLVGFASPIPREGLLKDGLVDIVSGAVGGRPSTIPLSIYKWLAQKARENADFKNKLSDRQWQIVANDISKAAPERLRATAAALASDRALFGKKADVPRRVP